MPKPGTPRRSKQAVSEPEPPEQATSVARRHAVFCPECEKNKKQVLMKPILVLKEGATLRTPVNICPACQHTIPRLHEIYCPDCDEFMLDSLAPQEGSRLKIPIFLCPNCKRELLRERPNTPIPETGIIQYPATAGGGRVGGESLSF